METSQNGWSASPNLKTRPLVVAGESFSPGIRDDDDVYTVLKYVAEQMHARVEPIVRPDWHQADDWGYYYRANRNDPTSLSNHSSGTAIDYNATRHPNGVPAGKTYTVKQITEIHRILAEVDGVVRWGGDYTRTVDAMHFEINASALGVAKVAARLRAPKPTPVPPPIVPPVKVKRPKGAPSGWSKFLHLADYLKSDSLAGLKWGRDHGYTSADMDAHIGADGTWWWLHWGDLRGYTRKGRAFRKSIRTLNRSDILGARSKFGALHSLDFGLQQAARLGYKRAEVEPKDVPTVEQFQHLKAVGEKYGIEIVVKRLSNIPRAAKCLHNAHAAGLQTMLLPRGTRVLSLTRFGPVTDYVRGPVKWVK